MIAFKRRTLFQSARYWLFPSVRRREDAELKDAIKQLFDHPEAPCVIGEHYIPNGFGHSQPVFGDYIQN